MRNLHKIMRLDRHKESYNTVLETRKRGIWLLASLQTHGHTDTHRHRTTTVTSMAHAPRVNNTCYVVLIWNVTACEIAVTASAIFTLYCHSVVSLRRHTTLLTLYAVFLTTEKLTHRASRLYKQIWPGYYVIHYKKPITQEQINAQVCNIITLLELQLLI